MLDTLAKAPIQATWGWLQGSLAGIVSSPEMLMKGLQAAMSLIATGVLALAAGWFIAVKATEVTINITATAVHISASAISKSV
ncbi:hypothetical protein NDA01_03740 [Trichocoleus desertorum AS-A10]|uniref:hypothetical protein n=1 Tax=Trichocoleus desertorum TaxID=1481672 RepID=UPI0032989F1F